MRSPNDHKAPIRTPDDLGIAIRAARKSQRLTLEQLSGLSGVGIRFLSELERGKPTVQLGKALAVAHLLGVELWTPLGRNEVNESGG